MYLISILLVFILNSLYIWCSEQEFYLSNLNPFALKECRLEYPEYDYTVTRNFLTQERKVKKSTPKKAFEVFRLYAKEINRLPKCKKTSVAIHKLTRPGRECMEERAYLASQLYSEYVLGMEKMPRPAHFGDVFTLAIAYIKERIFFDIIRSLSSDFSNYVFWHSKLSEHFGLVAWPFAQQPIRNSIAEEVLVKSLNSKLTTQAVLDLLTKWINSEPIRVSTSQNWIKLSIPKFGFKNSYAVTTNEVFFMLAFEGYDIK